MTVLKGSLILASDISTASKLISNQTFTYPSTIIAEPINTSSSIVENYQLWKNDITVFSPLYSQYAFQIICTATMQGNGITGQNPHWYFNVLLGERGIDPDNYPIHKSIQFSFDTNTFSGTPKTVTLVDNSLVRLERQIITSGNQVITNQRGYMGGVSWWEFDPNKQWCLWTRRYSSNQGNQFRVTSLKVTIYVWATLF